MNDSQQNLRRQRPLPGFRAVPRTGVIYVMHRAGQAGYQRGDDQWTNLGQGSPETGDLPGAPPRLENLSVDPSELAYGPVAGSMDLRDRVAQLYNRRYRRGLPAQYSAENVAIAGGGRTSVTRLVASMAEVNLGHFIPDYTAYEELLSAFKGFVPIPILLDPQSGYRASAAQLREEIVGRGLSAILASNPCNPTGQVVAGEDLNAWVETARECESALILDEFYSHYVYGDGKADDETDPPTVSAARYVEDIEKDPVVMVDGLTKNWRYPGWRLSWTVGPRTLIDQVSSAGSFLDGGANHPFQRQAAELLDPATTLAETRAIQREFHAKRRLMVDRLREIGVVVTHEPTGAFYVWGDLSELPLPLDDGMRFFEKALEVKVITVPGGFFDVNPGRRRAGTRYQSFSRFSFGSARESLEKGLDRLERLVASYR